MLSVGDEVTKTFVEQDSGTVLKDRQQCFFYEVAEGIFVLRNNLRYTGQISFCNSEIEGSCHSRRRLRTPKRKAAGKRLLCSDFRQPRTEGMQLFAREGEYFPNHMQVTLSVTTQCFTVDVADGIQHVIDRRERTQF